MLCLVQTTLLTASSDSDQWEIESTIPFLCPINFLNDDCPGRYNYTVEPKAPCNPPHQYSELGLKKEYFEAVASLPKQGFYPINSYAFIPRRKHTMNISAEAELVGSASFDNEEPRTQIKLCHTSIFLVRCDPDIDVFALVERISRQANYQKYQLRLLNLGYLDMFDSIRALWLYSPTDKNLIFLLNDAFNLPKGVELDFDLVQDVWSANENKLYKGWPKDRKSKSDFAF
jgi:hypothetical protein